MRRGAAHCVAMAAFAFGMDLSVRAVSQCGGRREAEGGKTGPATPPLPDVGKEVLALLADAAAGGEGSARLLRRYPGDLLAAACGARDGRLLSRLLAAGCIPQRSLVSHRLVSLVLPNIPLAETLRSAGAPVTSETLSHFLQRYSGEERGVATAWLLAAGATYPRDALLTELFPPAMLDDTAALGAALALLVRELCRSGVWFHTCPLPAPRPGAHTAFWEALSPWCLRKILDRTERVEVEHAVGLRDAGFPALAAEWVRAEVFERSMPAAPSADLVILLHAETRDARVFAVGEQGLPEEVAAVAAALGASCDSNALARGALLRVMRAPHQSGAASRILRDLVARPDFEADRVPVGCDHLLDTARGRVEDDVLLALFDATRDEAARARATAHMPLRLLTEVTGE